MAGPYVSVSILLAVQLAVWMRGRRRMRSANVHFDKTCPFCVRSRGILAAMTGEGAVEWTPSEPTGRLVCVTPERRYEGFLAVKWLLLSSWRVHLPIAVLGVYVPMIAPAMAALLLLLSSTALDSLGQRAYDFIAKRRHRLS